MPRPPSPRCPDAPAPGVPGARGPTGDPRGAGTSSPARPHTPGIRQSGSGMEGFPKEPESEGDPVRPIELWHQLICRLLDHRRRIEFRRRLFANLGQALKNILERGRSIDQK